MLSNISEQVCQGQNIGRTYILKEEIAKQYGVESAILIQHFQYSINYHKRNGNHFYEGRYWTYNSFPSLVNLYPFWSIQKIKRIIKYLLDKNVLISGNFNKHKYDRTKWYAFQNEEKFIPVDISVDKYENPVDMSVDNTGIKNKSTYQKGSIKKPGKKPFLSKNSSETRRNFHSSNPNDASFESDRSIPIYTSIYSSSDEVGTGSTYKNTLRSFYKIIDSHFPFMITNDYVLSSMIRKKLQGLGYNDDDIDKEILKMIRYHEQNPQIISNEKSCVLGWFKNSKKIEKRKKSKVKDDK